eukprot:403354435
MKCLFTVDIYLNHDLKQQERLFNDTDFEEPIRPKLDNCIAHSLHHKPYQSQQFFLKYNSPQIMFKMLSTQHLKVKAHEMSSGLSQNQSSSRLKYSLPQSLQQSPIKNGRSNYQQKSLIVYQDNDQQVEQIQMEICLKSVIPFQYSNNRKIIKQIKRNALFPSLNKSQQQVTLQDIKGNQSHSLSKLEISMETINKKVRNINENVLFEKFANKLDKEKSLTLNRVLHSSLEPPKEKFKLREGVTLINHLDQKVTKGPKYSSRPMHLSRQKFLKVQDQKESYDPQLELSVPTSNYSYNLISYQRNLAKENMKQMESVKIGKRHLLSISPDLRSTLNLNKKDDLELSQKQFESTNDLNQMETGDVKFFMDTEMSTLQHKKNNNYISNALQIQLKLNNSRSQQQSKVRFKNSEKLHIYNLDDLKENQIETKQQYSHTSIIPTNLDLKQIRGDLSHTFKKSRSQDKTSYNSIIDQYHTTQIASSQSFKINTHCHISINKNSKEKAFANKNLPPRPKIKKISKIQLPN